MEHEAFDEAFDSPDQWINTAEQHLTAARALYDALMRAAIPPEYDPYLHAWGCLRGCLGLLASASENALKAVIVANGFHRDERGRIDKGVMNEHRLLVLAERGGVQLDDEETPLLRKLTEYAIWAGRYRLPWTADAHRDAQALEVARAGIHEVELIWGLVGRLRAQAGELHTQRIREAGLLD